MAHQHPDKTKLLSHLQPNFFFSSFAAADSIATSVLYTFRIDLELALSAMSKMEDTVRRSIEERPTATISLSSTSL